MTQYIALVYEERRKFGASLPDFPGCISAGSSLQELRWMIHEALELHIEGMREDGYTIPEPSTLNQVLQHEDYDMAVALVVVTPGK